MKTEIEEIKTRIAEIALEHCGDYPNIKGIPAYSQLWAIEQTIKGIDAANKDAHKMIKILAAKLGLSDIELVNFWEKEIPILKE